MTILVAAAVVTLMLISFRRYGNMTARVLITGGYFRSGIHND